MGGSEGMLGLEGLRAEVRWAPWLEATALVMCDLQWQDGSAVPSVPRTLREARDLFEGSELARKAFGDQVCDHYLNNARVELEAFDSAVTDWERFRGFERL